MTAKAGSAGEQQQRQRCRLIEHEDEGDDARKAEYEQQPRTHADQLPDQRDVVDRARHQIAGRKLREETRAHQFEMPVEPLAKIEGDLDADLAHIAPPEIEGDIAHGHQPEDCQCREGKPRVASGNAVDAHFEVERHESFEQAPEIDQRHAAPEAKLVLLDERHKPPEGASFRGLARRFHGRTSGALARTGRSRAEMGATGPDFPAGPDRGRAAMLPGVVVFAVDYTPRKPIRKRACRPTVTTLSSESGIGGMFSGDPRSRHPFSPGEALARNRHPRRRRIRQTRDRQARRAPRPRPRRAPPQGRLTRRADGAPLHLALHRPCLSANLGGPGGRHGGDGADAGKPGGRHCVRWLQCDVVSCGGAGARDRARSQRGACRAGEIEARRRRPPAEP